MKNEITAGLRLLLLLCLMTAPFGAGATIIHVNPAATGSGDGSSWANGYTHLDSALLMANYGDSVWVKQGSYAVSSGGSGCAGTSPFFIREGIYVYGSFAGTEQKLSDRSGFTVPTSIIQGNSAEERLFAFNGISDSLTVINGFKFRNAGQALVAGSATMKIDSCQFENLSSNKGIIEVHEGDLSMYRSVFEQCTLTDYGAVLNINAQSLHVENCRFELNAGDGRKMFAGSVLFSDTSQVAFVNCEFIENTSTGSNWLAPAKGGSNLMLTNCSFHGTTIDTASSVAMFDTVQVFNSILFDPLELNHIEKMTAELILDHSIVPFAYSGTSLVHTSPQFADAANGDLSLLATSPAIDAGDNAFNSTIADIAHHLRLVNTTIDIGAHEYCAPCTPAKRAAEEAEEEEAVVPLVQVFPNPTTGNLSIQAEEAIESIEVFNSLGQTLMIAYPNASAHRLDLDDRASGFVTVKVKTAQSLTTHRVLVQ